MYISLSLSSGLHAYVAGPSTTEAVPCASNACVLFGSVSLPPNTSKEFERIFKIEVWRETESQLEPAHNISNLVQLSQKYIILEHLQKLFIFYSLFYSLFI
jgi:hypothetical protein